VVSNTHKRKENFGMYMRSVLATLALLACIMPRAASAADNLPLPATLDVSGHADIQRSPDRALIRAEISTNDASREEARKKNDEITARVVRSIMVLGLPERALRTAEYRSNYVPRDKDTPPDAMTGYVAVRAVEVSTTPQNVEAVTRALNEGGVREIEGVTTSISQSKPAYDTTLAAAVEDAQAQAQVIARAAHLRIVRILKIDTVQTPTFAPRMAKHMSAAIEAAPAAQDVELSAVVNVTYEIAPQR
jgi:uncharacterized protein YggE